MPLICFCLPPILKDLTIGMTVFQDCWVFVSFFLNMICYHFSFFPPPSPFSLLFLKTEFSLGEWRSGGVRGSLSGPQAHYLGQEESYVQTFTTAMLRFYVPSQFLSGNAARSTTLLRGCPIDCKGRTEFIWRRWGSDHGKSHRTDTKYQKGIGARSGVTGNLTARTSCG